jgi:ATP-binding cassette subfamily C protein LapB
MINETINKEQTLLDNALYVLQQQAVKLEKHILINEIHTYSKEINPASLVEVGSRLGLDIEIKSLKFSQIDNENLPLLLQTKQQDTIILSAIDHDTRQATIRETANAKPLDISFNDLKRKYSGEAIIIKPAANYETRADEHKLTPKRSAWFWGTLLQFSSIYRHVILAALIINIFTIAFPLFAMNVYDRVVPNQATATLWALAIGIFLAYIFDFILKTLRAHFLDVANKKFDLILSTRLLKKSMNTKMVDQPAAISVRANYLKEFDGVRDFFSSLVLTGTIDLPFTIIFLLVIGYIAGILVLVPLIATVLAIAITIFLSVPLYHYVNEASIGSSQKTAIMHEALNSLETIKNHVAYADILFRWRHYTTQVSNIMLKSRFFSTLGINVTGFFTQLASVIIIIVGVYKINMGELSTGGLIACTILASRCLSPLAQITSVLIRAQHTRISLDSLNDIMALPEERPDDKQYTAQNNLVGSIQFDRVSFLYPQQKTDSLQDISLKINPGEKVAILGSMGSGKSTLLRLILGLYEPTSGLIKIDGIDLAQWDPNHLRRSINYLDQNPSLLFGSALYNITLRHPNASEQEIQTAINIASLVNLLQQHPDGINMPIAEQGKGLSGGQKQSFALARSFVGDPKIVLLDEPTSEMDHTAEAQFIKKAPEYLKNKTLLLVTHKHSLLQLVNRIIILQNGKILLDGAKEDVLKQLQASSQTQPGER